MKLENLTARELTAQVRAALPEAVLTYLTKEQKSDIENINVTYIQSAPYLADEEDEDLQEIEVIGIVVRPNGGTLNFKVMLNWSIETEQMFGNYEPTFE